MFTLDKTAASFPFHNSDGQNQARTSWKTAEVWDEPYYLNGGWDVI